MITTILGVSFYYETISVSVTSVFFFSDNGICRPNFPTFFAPLVDYGIHVFWINSKMEKSFLNTFCLITNHEAVR